MGSPFNGCYRRYYMDCGSVVVCAARWSYMASGDGMMYRKSHGLYHSSHLVMHGGMGSLFGGQCRQYNNYITIHIFTYILKISPIIIIITALQHNTIHERHEE